MARPDDMQPARSSATRFTYEDYLNFPQDGRRHELIDGEHVVTPSPVRRHQELVVRLTAAMEVYLRGRPIGHVFVAPFDVILSDLDVVEPDLLYISNERSEILRDWVHGAPDLVVEILSPGTRKVDEITKRRLYDRVGVKEYWIVDPELDAVKIFHRAEDGTFPRIAELTREAQGLLTTPLLPAFSLSLDELFR
jgi:Uma2 family endonuclease